MTKVFYVSKLIGSVEFVLCDYQTGAEWVPAGQDDDWRFTSTDEDEANEAAATHGGSVEWFQRA